MTMTPSIWPSLLAFAAVIAAIPLALALLKRAQTIRPSRRGMVQVVGGAALGPRERIAVVEAGGKWLVLGVTSQSINLLTTLDEAPDGVAPPAAVTGQSEAPRFATLLSRFKNDVRS